MKCAGALHPRLVEDAVVSEKMRACSTAGNGLKWDSHGHAREPSRRFAPRVEIARLPQWHAVDALQQQVTNARLIDVHPEIRRTPDLNRRQQRFVHRTLPLL